MATERDLVSETRAALDVVVGRTASRSFCLPVAETARLWRAILDEPVRVAVAGEIKCGKSTLVNGLVGAEGALSVSTAVQDQAMATGQLETTYVLTELVHGHPTGLVVHHRNGSTTTAELGQLRNLTARREAGDTSLDEIDRVVVTIDAPLLSAFRLIDTPGFNSVYGTDAQASLDLLTSDECDRADAVLYTIAIKGLSDIGRDVARQFTSGRGGPTPMKAIGVVPRANEHWFDLLNVRATKDPTVDTDPFTLAHREIDQILSQGGTRGLFHTIVPVAGLLAEGAALAGDDELAALAAFTGLDPDELATSFVKHGPSKAFATRPDYPLDPHDRRRLVRRFSPWGTWKGVQLARVDPTPAVLRRRLDEASGVAGLRELVRNHFGGRAGTLRVREAIDTLRAEARRRRLPMPDDLADKAELAEVGTALEALDQRHRGRFVQLDVLGRHYRKELRFRPDQVEDLLRLTGEHGTDLASRLGMPAGATRNELRVSAEDAAARWAGHAATTSGLTRRAAEDLQRSCDDLLAEIDAGGH